MAVETVTVKEVSGPNPRGWYEISLEDGRVLSSNQEELVGVARQVAGSEVEADISVVEKGKYTNTYLNQINGVGAKPASNGGSRSAPASRGGRTPADNERIARQWAYGRAVELLMASGDVVDFSDGTKSTLTSWADWLLSQTR